MVNLGVVLGCSILLLLARVLGLPLDPLLPILLVPIASTLYFDRRARARRRDLEQTVTAAKTREEMIRQLSESIHEVFWLRENGNTRMLYVSPTYDTLFGRSSDALYRDARDWLQMVHPEDRARLEEAASRWHTAPEEHTFRIVRDGEVRTVHAALFPVLDADGRPTRLAGIADDITDRVGLEEQVRETQKLESLGLLAGGIAHDFNNVLAVIGANAGLLDFPPDDPDRELVDDIRAAVARATSLTRQLLAFSRKEVTLPVVLDVNATIADTRKMLRRMMGEDVVIESSLDPDLPNIKIDPGHFVQVMMNVAVNARDAMPTGGSLTIRTRASGDRVVVELADTGTGMPPEVIDRVFEPFFTTKAIGHGTGLGLSVVHGIVQQAGGRIEIVSRVGAGTTIRIALPAVDEVPEPLVHVAPVARGNETIVLVDDDLFVRRATARALRARGYTVIEASNAHTAMRSLEDHGDKVALLLTDVVMPEIDGCELAERARRSRPELKVLFMSGHADDALQRHGLQHDQISFLEKPFHSHALAGKVRHVLDRA